MDMLQLYRDQLDRMGDLIAGVRSDQMDEQTPCAEFDTRALINHIIGGTAMMGIIAEGGTVDVDGPTPDLAGEDPVSVYAGAKRKALDGFSAPGAMERQFAFPFGTLPGPMALAVALTETVIHGWDLAKATGQDTTIDPGLAETLLAGAQRMLGPQAREGGAFGPAVDVPDDASPTDKLVAFMGRRP